VPWAQVLREKIPALVAWEEHVIAFAACDEPLVPSQRDLHPPNVIRRSDGSQAVIDWDAAGPVRASEDVAMFALVWDSAEDKAPSTDAVRAFVRGYRDAGGHFKPHGIADLSHRERARLAWIAYNVQRHMSQPPGPNPWLPPALLSGVQPPDLDALRRTAALFEGA
jgi:aminoglycoside phosphotransferase (APT) family kinase protein